MEQDRYRPPVRLPLSRRERVLLGIGAGCLAAAGIWLALHWTQIPAIIPTHYGFSGKADGFGPKGSLVFLYGIGWAVWGLPALVRRYPRSWNVADNSLTGAYKAGPAGERLYRLTGELLCQMAAGIGGIFAFLCRWSPGGADLPVWALPVFLLLLFGPVGVYFYRARQGR